MGGLVAAWLAPQISRLLPEEGPQLPASSANSGPSAESADRPPPAAAALDAGQAVKRIAATRRPRKKAPSGPAAETAGADEAGLANIRALKQLIVTALDEDKAEDIVAIDLTGKSALADFMVIASGRSARHVAAIADHLARRLREAGRHAPAIEGLPSADWVLIDAGDIVVHLFRPEVRAFYNLERIWAEPPALRPALHA